MLYHHQAAVVVKLGQRLAVDAFGLFGKPFDKTGTVGDFAFGLGQGLALFGRHDACNIVLVGHQQIKPLAQDDAAFFGGFGLPCRPRSVGCGNGRFGVFGPQVGHIREFVSGGGIHNVKTACALDPLAVDERIGLQQAGVFELGEWGSGHTVLAVRLSNKGILFNDAS